MAAISAAGPSAQEICAARRVFRGCLASKASFFDAIVVYICNTPPLHSLYSSHLSLPPSFPVLWPLVSFGVRAINVHLGTVFGWPFWLIMFSMIIDSHSSFHLPPQFLHFSSFLPTKTRFLSVFVFSSELSCSFSMFAETLKSLSPLLSLFRRELLLIDKAVLMKLKGVCLSYIFCCLANNFLLHSRLTFISLSISLNNELLFRAT